MKVKDLVAKWGQAGERRQAVRTYEVRLPLHDAARLHALVEMYEGRQVEDFVTDLLSAALDEVERAFPYVQGAEVVAEDEYGDPIYRDDGPTPKFSQLTKKYVRLLQAD